MVCPFGSPTAQRGVVYLEMLLALMPIMLTFLGICQLALLYSGQLIVQHAATRAARAAMVVLEDDPKHHDDAARGDLADGEGDKNAGVPEEFQAQAPADSYLALPAETPSIPDASAPSPASASDADSDDAPPQAGARWDDIRAAAYHPLSVLAPSLASLTSHTLESELSRGAFDRIIAGRFLYNLGAAAVTLHEPDSDEVLTEVHRHASVTVRVAFLMPCGVPIVSSLLCYGRMSIWGARFGLSENDEVKRLLEKTELVESPELRDAIFLLIPRLTLLTAEATMPNQGADYYER